MVLFRQFLWLFLALALQIAPTKSETWRVAALEWPPYASPDLPGGGIAVAELRKVLESGGIELQIEYMPWPRAQALARSGSYVGYFPAWPEEVRAGFLGSDPLVMSYVGVVQMKETPVSWGSLEDLFKKYRVGYVSTYVYPKEIQTLLDRNRPLEAGCDNERDLTRKMAAGRMDLAITDPNVMLYFAQELGFDNLEANPSLITEKPLVLAIPNQPAFKARRHLLNELIEQHNAAN
ncbi:substrate-binding periplasmic protein [Roseibium sp.]|uniref:substrate-binding periplasmic protein n=1 Tax=Roseibium sp. TaxID=1936156 RepID=UPI003B52BD6C